MERKKEKKNLGSYDNDKINVRTRNKNHVI